MNHEVRRSSPPPLPPHLRESGSGVCMTKHERERERERGVYVCERTGNKHIDLVGRMTTYETCPEGRWESDVCDGSDIFTSSRRLYRLISLARDIQ